MKTMLRSIGGLALLMALVPGAIGSVSAAHNGDNKAALTGTGDPDATGRAIVNDREGAGTFNRTITVLNLTPGETYTLSVNLNGNADQMICSGDADADGTFTCSSQGLTLASFNRAAVRDSAGTEVASGVFARRGNCRDPQQAGSLCQSQAAGH